MKPFTKENWEPVDIFKDNGKVGDMFYESDKDGEPVLKMRIDKKMVEDQIKFWSKDD